MTATATRKTTDSEPITDAQRRAIFAAGHSLGLDIDDLRDLTPAGSISKLTRAEAARVLDRLNRGTDREHPRRRPRRQRRPKGVYAISTDVQRRKIEALRIDLDWSEEKMQTWLSERHYAGTRRPMTRMDSTADASEVIELLKAVLARSARSRKRSGRRTAGQHPTRRTHDEFSGGCRVRAPCRPRCRLGPDNRALMGV